MNIFEKASRAKIRFDTPVGVLSVDDLWDLPLTSKVGGVNLDDIARDLDSQVSQTERSFVEKPARENVLLVLSFDIVKHVIYVKLDERAELKAAKAKADKKAKILAIMARKQDQALEESSEEDLQRMLDEL